MANPKISQEQFFTNLKKYHFEFVLLNIIRHLLPYKKIIRTYFMKKKEAGRRR